MKYFIALNEDKQILSLIYVGRKPIVIKTTLNYINKKKCVYYSEYELKRIEFPEQVILQEIDPKKYGGCKLIPKAEEQEDLKNI